MSECTERGCRKLETKCADCGRLVIDRIMPKCPEWISINEAIPNEGICVLTWDGKYMRTAEILYQEASIITWMDGGVCFNHVTHWANLPGVPK